MFLQLQPIYGQHYKAGQIYFTYTVNNPISKGVSWFTQRELKDCEELKRISHCGIVVSKEVGIAALAEKNAFDYQHLNVLFDDPYCRIFFREPRMLDQFGSEFLVKSAVGYRGTPYNYKLVTGFAIVNSWLGRFLLSEIDKKHILEKMSKKGTLICSQAVMMLTYLSSMHSDFDFIKSPYEVFLHSMFKDWK